MPACPSCGHDNPDEARFCMACAAPLAAAEPAREQRKVVTVLFCDLVGSTALGESSDPEVVRARLARTFDELRGILEHHGGTVEKFVGDAVMAVFGIPAAHEDDAHRAARAAVEMREAVSAHGLEARIGINTGEVVVGGDGETLVTGDAVNVAARLEQAAAPGSILMGSATRQLVRDAVTAEAVESLQLKGKSEPVQAFQLIDVLAGAAPLARHLETPLVGRERERRRLRRDYEDAVADSTCRLFTLLGPAGIGKSRLVADFLEQVAGESDVLRGRCLSYGEGITYWPLVEMLLAIGVEPDAVIGASPPETQLAFRRLLEARAAEQPQVVVIDDLQWAEPVFVDLIEHVADFSRDAPIFLLCVARTELLDGRPDWGGGKMNASSLLLEPLDEEECGELMDRLVDHAALDDALRQRITEASAGNPLFVEEMLAMVREQGGGEVVVPPTIHALLQARIDALDGDVRAVMERGAVEGEIFHRGTVAQLAPPAVRDGVETHLATLVRKELIRSTTPTFPNDEGFRFRHLLIRDAAYESLPKATRAELHERFADWLAEHELIERDEILGYHLEQAHRYRAELASGDPTLYELARRASSHLADAGRGALDRDDFNAGRSLLMRASDLLPEGDEARLALAPDYAAALFEIGGEGLWDVLVTATHAATPRTRALALVSMATWGLTGNFDRPRDERNAWRDEARSIFEASQDDYGFGLYWWSVSLEAWFALRAGEAAAASERSLEYLSRAGASRSRIAQMVTRWLVVSQIYTGDPIGESIGRIQSLRVEEYGVLSDALARSVVGRLHAMAGDFDRGRELSRGARELYVDAGQLQSAGGMAMSEAHIEWLAGDDGAAERILCDGLRRLEAIDERAYYPTAALQLAQLLYAHGRFDEVREWCEKARSTTGEDDLTNFIELDLFESLLLARAGQPQEAEALGARVVARLEGIDMSEIEAMAHERLAELFVLTGRDELAREHGAISLATAGRKGDVALAARLRERLTASGIHVS
jgi:class 3 adenylate cyclase